METVREIWRAADDAMMGQYAIGSYTSVFRDPGCPRVGGLFDLVFTTERLVFVTAELQQDTTGQWVLGGAIAGPVGIAVVGGIGALWNTYKAARDRRKIDATMLDSMIGNGIAISAGLDGLSCEVNPLKRTYFAIRENCVVTFSGEFRYRDIALHGALLRLWEKSAATMRRRMRNLLPLDVRLGEKLSWDDWAEKIEARVRAAEAQGRSDC